MNPPIAYTYEADTHCPACAVARFGREPKNRCAICGEPANAVPISMAGTLHRFGPVASHDFAPAYYPWPPDSAIDSEGNGVGAIAPWDDWCQGEDLDFIGDTAHCTLECATCHGTIDDHVHVRRAALLEA